MNNVEIIKKEKAGEPIQLFAMDVGTREYTARAVVENGKVVSISYIPSQSAIPSMDRTRILCKFLDFVKE